ncbi:MAG: hypothetical protein QF637_08930 [Acidimicrobiales bacterium]|nr:hypothetical protein [Acidimicrobiales bacterium]
MMRYPTLDTTPLKALASRSLGNEELGQDEQDQIKAHRVDRGSGDTMDLRRLEERVKEMKSLHRELLIDPYYWGYLYRIDGRLS